MLYYTNKARQTARDSIADLRVKLANMPLNIDGGLNYTDMGNLQHYLETLDQAIYREMRDRPWE